MQYFSLKLDNLFLEKKLDDPTTHYIAATSAPQDLLKKYHWKIKKKNTIVGRFKKYRCQE